MVGLGLGAGIAEEVWVVAHPSVQRIDRQTLQRIYTGRVLSIGGQAVLPVNLPPGNLVREEFLRVCLDQAEEQYTGYWLVRRYVGKGTPPPELLGVDEVIRHIQATPGAIGYLPASRAPRGVNVIFKP